MPFKSKADRAAYDRTLRDARQVHKQRYRKRFGSAPQRSFVGVDGEGGNTPDGHHHFYLLRAGTRTIDSRNYGDRPLTTFQCLSFLSSLDPRYEYVSYYFSYDVAMICRSLPPDRLLRLRRREQRRIKPKDGGLSSSYWPVTVGDFDLDWLPTKEFKVRRAGGPWVAISDVGAFFQTSFLNALISWDIGTPDEREAIRQGKLRRGSFGLPDDEERRYNALECDLLVQLMDQLRDTCKAVGYLPARWQGPGHLAVAMMKAHDIPQSRDLVCTRVPELMAAARAAYYGGNFNRTTAGPVHGPVYAADIHNAYPFAITRMPCLYHGAWRHRRGPLPAAPTPMNPNLWTDGFGHPPYLAYGSFEPREGQSALMWGFPVRRKNHTIYMPARGRGWYWSMEIDQAAHQRFTVEEYWIYERRCDCQPFTYINDRYEDRKAMGKDDRGTVIKLGLNSHAGKAMQSVGSAPYGNPIAAGFITSYTRAQLQEYMHSLPSCVLRHQCGEHVHMVATDGIFTTELPIPALSPPFSDRIGEWDIKTLDDGIFIVQPGFYYGVDRARPKSRGMNLNKALEYEGAFRDAFQVMRRVGRPDVGVTIPLTQFMGIGQGVHLGAWDRIGQWEDMPRRITFDWRSKCRARPVIRNGMLRLLPLTGDNAIESVPYDRDIGRTLEAARIGDLEQPDWAHYVGNGSED